MKKIIFILFLLPFTITLSQCISGNCKVGFGTFKYKNGNIYTGEWWNNEMNGQGTLIWPDGSVYVGEFQNGMYNGIGTYLDNKKNIYIGDFIEEMENGQGTKLFSNGNIYIGELKEGEMHGYGTLIQRPSCDSNPKNEPKIMQGYWKNNQAVNQY